MCEGLIIKQARKNWGGCTARGKGAWGKGAVAVKLER